MGKKSRELLGPWELGIHSSVQMWSGGGPEWVCHLTHGRGGAKGRKEKDLQKFPAQVEGPFSPVLRVNLPLLGDQVSGVGTESK